MRRMVALVGALLLLLVVAAPALAADPTLPQTGRVLISIEGDLTVPAGDQADAVIVIEGNASIAGTVNAVTVVNGTATLTGATVQTLTVVDGTAVLAAGTTVLGDVLQFNSIVERAEGVTVGGAVRPLADDLAGLAVFLGFAALLFWVGVILATLVAGLALAALAARQVRTAETIISREPVKAFLAGLAMIVLPFIAFVLLALTIVGLPLALSLLLIAWPALAFVGYLVAAIWIGDWVLRAAGRQPESDRPYRATIVGLIVAGVLGFVPLVTAIISIFGLGAVTVAGWRTLTGGRTSHPALQPQSAPTPA